MTTVVFTDFFFLNPDILVQMTHFWNNPHRVAGYLDKGQNELHNIPYHRNGSKIRPKNLMKTKIKYNTSNYI